MFRPIDTGSSRSKGCVIGLNNLAVFIAQIGMGNFVFLGVGVLNIADSVFDATHIGSNTFVTFAAY